MGASQQQQQQQPQSAVMRAALPPRLYAVIGRDNLARGFAYMVERDAKAGAREADDTYPTSAPHRVVAYEPWEVRP